MIKASLFCLPLEHNQKKQSYRVSKNKMRRPPRWIILNLIEWEPRRFQNCWNDDCDNKYLGLPLLTSPLLPHSQNPRHCDMSVISHAPPPSIFRISIPGRRNWPPLFHINRTYSAFEVHRPLWKSFLRESEKKMRLQDLQRCSFMIRPVPTGAFSAMFTHIPSMTYRNRLRKTLTSQHLLAMAAKYKIPFSPDKFLRQGCFGRLCCVHVSESWFCLTLSSVVNVKQGAAPAPASIRRMIPSWALVPTPTKKHLLDERKVEGLQAIVS